MSSTRVAMWEAPLSIPTYRLGEPEVNPIFYTGRAYQGAKGPVYPYPLLDKLTTDRQDKTYRAIYLENPYLQLTLLPELGGRLFAAQDKTNGYDFIYRQHVIKPALIGMLGAWISGGAEWDLPHHHRASTYMPVDFEPVENPDGSKTLWVGETELRHRMRWTVGVTLFPDRSYLETTITLRNRTPLAHSFLCFTNLAVPVNEHYQVIFPPSTEFGVQHAKCEFLHWPVAREIYSGADFRAGVDVSWWKNHPNWISIFAWNHQDDFFGGYDHGRDAGIAHVADHHTVPGKKFFEFGNGTPGQAWDRILTEVDGPYVELMAGAYSDNQPDYSWIQPYEVKTVKQYWYPLRGLGGLKKANRDAALNLEIVGGNRIRLAFNTTAEFRDATVLLRGRDQVLVQEKLTIRPDAPYRREISLPAGLAETDLELSLLSASGKPLIAYRPAAPKNSPTPPVVIPPKPPKEVPTNEELYLAGLRLEQFHSPAMEPDPYYLEALARDPGDARANTALGILYYRRGLFAEARRKLETAVARLTRNHTRARNGEAHYYLGLTLLVQRQFATAEDALNRAAWDFAFRAPCYYELANLALAQGLLDSALEYTDASLAHNTLNNQAQALKALLLRQFGQFDRAQALLDQALTSDPLDFRLLHERVLTLRAAGQADDATGNEQKLLDLMRDGTESHLELASDYARASQWADAIAILNRFIARKAPSGATTVDPMVHYTLAYYHQQAGDAQAAARHYDLGRQMPPAYCFPFRLESIDVLRSAIAHNASDPRAPYYLGNLLYDLQPQAARELWERSRELDPGFATVHRNLALAYSRGQGTRPQAIASLQKACACDPNDPKLHVELDILLEAEGTDPRERLANLQKHHQAIRRRDDGLLRQATLHVLLEQYDEALAALENHHFHVWEGGELAVHNVYTDAHLLRGRQRLEAGQAREALADFEAALEYPDRFEVGRPYDGGRAPEASYLAAQACKALGQGDKARTFLQQAVAKDRRGVYLAYYQALAWRELGQEEKAKGLLESLTKAGQDLLSRAPALDFFEKFGAREDDRRQKAQGHYLVALALLGQGEAAQAQAELDKAVAHNPGHLGVRAVRSFAGIAATR